MNTVDFINQIIANNGAQVRSNMYQSGFNFNANLDAVNLLSILQNSNLNYSEQVNKLAKILDVPIIPSNDFATNLGLVKNQYYSLANAISQNFNLALKKNAAITEDNTVDKYIGIFEDLFKKPKFKYAFYAFSVVGVFFVIAAIIKIFINIFDNE